MRNRMESYPRLLNHAEDIYGTEINPIVISRQSYLGRQRGGFGMGRPIPTLPCLFKRILIPFSY